MNMFNSFDLQLCWTATLTLLHMTWIGVAVGAIALAGDRLLRSSTASRRYWFQMAALLTLGLALPIAFGVVRNSIAVRSEIAAPPPLKSIAFAPSVRLRTVVEPSAQPKKIKIKTGEPNVAKAAIAVEKRADFDFARIAREISPFVAILYSLGVAAMLLKLLLAVSGGRRLRAASRPINDQKILDLFERQVARLASSRACDRPLRARRRSGGDRHLAAVDRLAGEFVDRLDRR